MRRNLRYMHFKGFYRLSLLLMCGDTATNPGPTKHPCGLCSRAVAKQPGQSYVRLVITCYI